MVILEVSLILSVLLLFMITDSRTVTFLAEKTLPLTKFTYKSIEGNLFEGLRVEELTYDNHQLFSKATVHWNPISLFYHKVSLTRVEVEGVDLDSVVEMVENLKSDSNRSSAFSLDYTLSLSNIHLDINPYVFEGVKLSSFLLESGGVDIDKDLTIESEQLKLAFNSDIVNVKLNGKIKENRLLLDEVYLNNISSLSITKLVQQLSNKKKSKKSSTALLTPFKEIKVKHIVGTLKPVTYGEFTIKGVTLDLYNGVINPYKHYEYRVKKLRLKGDTNFGTINYKGSIKKSTIYAKGEIQLKRELFTKYHLPLNFKALERLPSSLILNHHGVWIEIEHQLESLLLDNENFNIDISNADHKLAYIYGKNLEIESKIDGSNSYANRMQLNVKTVVDFKKAETIYKGEVELDELQRLPDKVSTYLLPNLKGNFRGDLNGLHVGVTSERFKGGLELEEYQFLNVHLATKKRNIPLGKLFPSLTRYQNETLGLKATAFLPLKKIEDSKITLDIDSNLLNLTATMGLNVPYEIDFRAYLPQNSKLREIDKKIKFSRLRHLFGKVMLDKNQLKAKIENQEGLSVELNYDTQKSKLLKADIFLEEIGIYLVTTAKGELQIESYIANLQKSLKVLQDYYQFEAPAIEGAVDIVLTQNKKETFSCHIESKNIKYRSDKDTFNIYRINSDFTVDKNLNIVIKGYRFNIDENEYLYKFFSNRNSYLSFKNGNLNIKKFWVNDLIKIEGDYAFESKIGVLFIKVHPYHFTNKNVDLLFNVNVKAKILGDKFDVSGDVDILGNSINYELPMAGIIEDSDIIIVQEMNKKKELPFQNLKLYIKIKSSQPLHYLGENVEVNFVNDLSIVKNYKQNMVITGVSTIKDGYYDLEDKHFLLDESYLYFVGDVKKPLLDIKADYIKDQYTIHIFISGTSEEPIVNFNADPYLTQQEILSLILFDEIVTGNGKGAEAYTLLGGAIAKELMKSLGIDIDHFSVGTDENDQLSLEVGTKISKDISLLYLNRDGLNGAKVRVEHSKRFETDIIIMPPNTSSIEFLYKSDH